ncbi:MAG TPA: ribbon-helix-helix domain-containing protein [Gammaproteobacteria bacterium]|nr:ribbon-helix-helix domain-containing protein [Gammaproteobacteria bacterium]
MLAIRLPKALEDRLQKLADKENRSKSYYARKALEQYIQDREDYLLAVSRFESGSKSVSLKKLGEQLGLVNKSKRRSKKGSKKT